MSTLHVISTEKKGSFKQSEQACQFDFVEQLEDIDSILQIANRSSAEWFLLAQDVAGTDLVPTDQSLQAIQEKSFTTWLPKLPGSFADFTLRSLGGKMASLWIELWKSGAVLTPAEVLRTELRESQTLHELMTKLNWGSAPNETYMEIDWSDHSVELPELTPMNQRSRLKQIEPMIQNLEEILPGQYDRSSPDFTALRAGLYQWHDALETSHGYSQSAQHRGKNQAADYWHAIMHRREPDYSNSKYWFRHVGNSPVYAKLCRYAQSISTDLAAGEAWQPFGFVDFCSRCRQGSDEELIARRIQAVEMVLLMQQTMADAKK